MKYRQITHRGERRLLLLFGFNPELNQAVKQLPSAKWSKSRGGWHICADNKTFTCFKDRFPEALPDAGQEDWLRTSKNNPPEPYSKAREKEMKVVQEVTGRLRLLFYFDRELTELIKTFPFAFYNKHLKLWDIADSEKTRSRLKQFCQMNNWNLVYRNNVRKSTIRPRLQPYQVPNYRHCPENYRLKLQLERYAENTIKNYCDHFEEFINFYPTKKPEEITEPEITAFIRYLVQERGIGSSFQNSAINAIKFYYEKLLGGRRTFYQLERPLRESKLPVVLSEREVASVLTATPNLKHRAMLTLCYSAGLRLNELINLTPKDIDSDSMQVWIRGAKGKKDRFSLLSEKALPLLRKYYREYRPGYYLFEGRNGGPYAARSIQKAMAASCRRAGILKHATMHTLRHSFGTHMLENGTDLRYIQALLGHSSPKTTEIYTHITTKGLEKIKSPLDTLGLDDSVL